MRREHLSLDLHAIVSFSSVRAETNTMALDLIKYQKSFTLGINMLDDAVGSCLIFHVQNKYDTNNAKT